MHDAEILEIARGCLAAEAEAVRAAAGQLDASFVQAARLCLDCRGHVLVAGSGTSHPVAARLAHLLSCCGTPALFIHPGDTQHGQAGAVTERDVLIAISKGGETAEVNHLAQVARRRGAKVIALCERRDSTLGGVADCLIKIKSPEEIDPYGMIATGSSLVNSAVCDALCTVLLRMRGYTKEQFAETHPGGAVGRRLEEERR